MRILFDARSLDALPSGTKTRLRLLAPELARRGHVVAAAHAPDLDAETRRLLSACALHDVGEPWRQGILGRARRQRAELDPIVRDAAPDVVVGETWPPYAPPAPVGTIHVVHDLRRLAARTPTERLARRWFRRRLAEALAGPGRVQAVSASVRAEAAATGFDVARMDVAPNAVAPRTAPPPEAHLPAVLEGRPFVLVVGHDEPRKAHGIAAAVAVAPEVARRAVVARVGRGAPRLAGLIDLGVVDDATRDLLLARAAVVLAPARYEGFGLAPLEAAAAGARVAASGIPAHREVLGDAARYFPPDDAAAAAVVVAAELALSPAEAADRAEKARARAATWSVARAADAFEASLARLR